MPRVLHVLPHTGGGAETYLAAMRDALPEWRHDRIELSAGRRPADALRSLPLRGPAALRAALRADAVHAHGDVAALLALPLLRLRPGVVTTHGLHLLRRSDKAAVRGWLRAALRSAACVICTSEAERAELARLEPRLALRVIHNSVQAVPPPDPADRLAARAALGLAEQDVAVLFAGRLEDRKRALLAAEAIERAGAPLVLLVAGDGPERAALDRSAGERVRTLGFRDDVPALMDAADLFVAPADREGLSYALLEALAHGLPVVASDGPGNPEAVGDAGIVVPAGDADALASALAQLAADPARRGALAARARERAASEFSPERFAAAVREVYARLR